MKKQMVTLLEDHSGVIFKSSGPAPAIHTLPDPRNRAPRSYLFMDGKVLEFTRVGNPETSPSSWFIDQTCKSDGSLMTATSVDPIFFLLPVLEAAGSSRSSPLQQCLSTYPGGDCSLLLGLNGLESRLTAVADVKDGLSPGFANLLVRLDRGRALDTLYSKAQSIALSMCVEGEASKARAKAAMLGSFSVGTTTASPLMGSPTSSAQGAPTEPQAVHFEEALGLLSMYLHEDWLVALRERVLRCVIHLLFPSPSKSLPPACAFLPVNSTPPANPPLYAPNPLPCRPTQQPSSSPIATAVGLDSVVTPEVGGRADAWNSAALYDPYTAISKYVHGSRGGAGGGAGKVVPKTNSISANRLAAAAKGKGVVSVASFFKPVAKQQQQLNES